MKCLNCGCQSEDNVPYCSDSCYYSHVSEELQIVDKPDDHYEWFHSPSCEWTQEELDSVWF